MWRVLFFCERQVRVDPVLAGESSAAPRTQRGIACLSGGCNVREAGGRPEPRGIG
jgi:hypothetical protein